METVNCSPPLSPSPKHLSLSLSRQTSGAGTEVDVWSPSAGRVAGSSCGSLSDAGAYMRASLWWFSTQMVWLGTTCSVPETCCKNEAVHQPRQTPHPPTSPSMFMMPRSSSGSSVNARHLTYLMYGCSCDLPPSRFNRNFNTLDRFG